MTIVSYELTPDESSRLKAADDILQVLAQQACEYRELRDKARTGGAQEELMHMCHACDRLELAVKRYREDIYKTAMERSGCGCNG